MRISCLVGSGKRCLGDIFPKAEMIALAAMGFDGYNQVAQTLSIAQLAKHHGKQLVPACEVFHIFVPSILTDEIIEVVPVKEYCQLGENIL